MNKGKIPTIIGLLILIVGIAVGVFLVQRRQIFRLGAETDIIPKDVRISNITDSSFTVSWTTDRETSGFVLWGENQSSLTRTESDEVSSSGNTHLANIRGLSPSSDYFFKINSGGDTFDNDNIPWQITTGAQLPPPAKASTISGSVLTASGEPSPNSLVYITVGSASFLSTATSQSGSWVISLSSARNSNLDAYYEVDPVNDVIEILVQAGKGQVSSAQIYAQSAKPAPPLILGQVHDFKNLPPSKEEELPESVLELPEGLERSSKFKVEEEASKPSTKDVSLDSLDEGEVITSTKPEFFGEGPAGTEITIEVESEVITDTTSVTTSGIWRWSPPDDLSPGAHKITISWRDENGILQSITRTFIVQASEAPSFESTPSGQTPTPTATATSTPTSTPTSSPSFNLSTMTPTPTATGTATPTTTYSPTPTSSAPPLPASGNLTPTLILSIMGIGLLSASAVAIHLAYKEKSD
jgi:hypothetical protein